MANSIEEGPTRGLTCIFLSCAIFTTSAPGSAIAGHPASDSKPTIFPSKQEFKNDGMSAGSVNLFKGCKIKSGKDFLGQTLLINRLAVFSFFLILITNKGKR